MRYNPVRVAQAIDQPVAELDSIYWLRYRMTRRRTDLSSGWTSYEVIHKNEARTTPFSDALAARGDLAGAINKISLVEEVGWPKARQVLHYGPGHKKRIAKKDDVIWLLKCWKSCWRLYFYVIPSEKKYIVYVHAVCKKKNQEDPGEAVTARKVYDGIQVGRSAITPFQFPA